MRITKDTPISELYHEELSDDELMHWKYIKREKINGKWRYYYDYKSLKKDVKSVVSNITNKTSKLVNSGKKSLGNQASKTIKSVSSKISKNIKDAVESVKKRVFKYIAKVPDGDSYRYFYSEKAYRSYINGKNAVDKILDKKLNTTASDAAKANAKNFTLNTLFGGFGKAVYNLVAPALTALQIELTTPKSFSELKKADPKTTNDEHQKAVNPDYNRETYDYSMNCSFCTAAYDLRKRGYDVEANPISTVEAYTIKDVCSWYKGAKSVSKSTVEYNYMTDPEVERPSISKVDMLKHELAKHGDGARGHLALYWATGGGHDVIWEVENGEVVIRDCQTGEVSKTLSMLSYASSYDYVRTDNLEPTEEVLRTVRNRKGR